jgi:homoserine O-acetyltransferase
MSTDNTRRSVGRVETRLARIELPPGGFKLESGEILPELVVAYETYGELSPEKDNAIFVCHALSGDAHVAGYHDTPEPSPGWWDEMIGPGKGIDTTYYHVVCANILGGCKGTTGPSSINPATGRPYGSAFPAITVGDMVDVHRLLVLHLGVQRLAAVLGGSFGGMQALDWAMRYPDMIDRCICIASATSLSAQALAFDIVGRKVIMSDADWQGGDFYGTARAPARGLAQARMIGHITYLSPEMMTSKFGRERRNPEPGDRAGASPETKFSTNFQVESYLDHQGDKLVRRFDANSYLHITRAMDEYDILSRFGSLENALKPIRAKLLVVALSSDWLFPPEQSVELANALLQAGKRVSYCRLHAPHGHDAFLVEISHLAEVIRAFLPWVKKGKTAVEEPAGRSEFRVIRGMVRPNARVLDLGCGNGDLLSLLARDKPIAGIGVDIDLAHVIDVIDKGHDVFQADVDAGLAMIPDGAYDYVILSEMLQVVRRPRFVLKEMLRVGREGIVSFANFGNWSNRVHLWARGSMPKAGAPVSEWYDTPNTHLFTLRDLRDLCRAENIEILETVCIPGGELDRLLLKMGFCNLGAERVLVRIARGTGGACACRGCRPLS